MKKAIWLQLLLPVALSLGALVPLPADAIPLDLYVTEAGGNIYEYSPTGTRTTFATPPPIEAGLSFFDTRGLAFGPAGNLFVAAFRLRNPGPVADAAVLKFNSAGKGTTFGTIPGDVTLEGVAINSKGNVFVAAQDNGSQVGASTIFKLGAGGRPTVFGSLPGQTFGLAFDQAGNLFAADTVDNAIYKFALDGTRSIFASDVGSGPGDPRPIDLAFDAAGNLFVSLAGTLFVPDGAVVEISTTGIETTFATGLNYPRGLAFDPQGNLFVTELTGEDILRFTPNGSRSIFASDSFNPEFIPLDREALWQMCRTAGQRPFFSARAPLRYCLLADS